ncbi:NUDIX hydrolase [Paenibacillus alginolyticus]|uniref:NUDIX domain-containing protein n=1 Tax=Paenibacillus alginolyticus TaxID=59839 RepID=A0ABT4GIQ2_9BACL|nr:NUDIX domain-containing protein [Paenibacillus alginolyticus]MCY9696087.1 NUDIX domain-containing protein [Paenibacillus alginolyticus]MEC0143366.1 NUDIX domain-containing protein [Paenibacillus alginolyticus]
MSNKMMGAAAIILDSERRILLVKHSYGKNNWDLPGGKSEANESAQETAKREVLEETGLKVEVGQLTGIYYDPIYDMHHFVFISNNENQQEPVPSSPEILECRYYSIDELPKPISDFTYKRIHDALKHDRQHLFQTIGPRQWIE